VHLQNIQLYLIDPFLTVENISKPIIYLLLLKGCKYITSLTTTGCGLSYTFPHTLWKTCGKLSLNCYQRHIKINQKSLLFHANALDKSRLYIGMTCVYSLSERFLIHREKCSKSQQNKSSPFFLCILLSHLHKSLVHSAYRSASNVFEYCIIGFLIALYSVILS
jgi:hypothetical protein